MNSDIFKGLLKKEKGKYFTEMVDRLQSLKYLYLVLNSLLTPGIDRENWNTTEVW